ncbi:MAG: VTT domain-containing protein [Defluviimonas sp.]|uniref:DedA family protein n=1 Tax=Albidovulum sp. TaxID=1872424 RepID=UPI001E0C45C2|nr:VTT domain-containing protein [Paracoccaceae bacterium]MCC0063717.1 VTT domain-containing protein [Defluviimonas sp.]
MIEDVLSQWGLPAVFAGAFAEGEVAAFLGGVLAHRGFFSFETAALAASAGAFAVDQLVFHIGRHAARFPRAARALGRPAAQALLGRLRQQPVLTCLGFRFLYGLKTVGALALGASTLSPVRFAWLDLVSALVWGHLLTGLGYGAGQAIERAFGRLELHQHLGIVLAVLAVLLLAAEVLRRRRRR